MLRSCCPGTNVCLVLVKLGGATKRHSGSGPEHSQPACQYTSEYWIARVSPVSTDAIATVSPHLSMYSRAIMRAYLRGPKRLRMMQWATGRNPQPPLSAIATDYGAPVLNKYAIPLSSG